MGTNYEHIDKSVVSTSCSKDVFAIQYGCGCVKEGVVNDSSEDTCVKECVDDDTCLCLAQHQSYYKDGKLYNFDGLEPMYECNDCCSCSNKCQNRIIQNKSMWCLCTQKTISKGTGLFTKSFIPKGSFVIEYIGEYLTQPEAKERIVLLDDNEASYVVVLLEHYGDHTVTTYVDASMKGNLARFINHSCQPNLEMVPVRVNSSLPHLTLFACQDIDINEELSFNYGRSIQNAHLAKQTKCYCGTQVCAGFLPFDKTLF